MFKRSLEEDHNYWWCVSLAHGIKVKVSVWLVDPLLLLWPLDAVNLINLSIYLPIYLELCGLCKCAGVGKKRRNEVGHFHTLMKESDFMPWKHLCVLISLFFGPGPHKPLFLLLALEIFNAFNPLFVVALFNQEPHRCISLLFYWLSPAPRHLTFFSPSMTANPENHISPFELWRK